MENKACCFSGHRKIESDKIDILCQRLENTVRKLIADGYMDFYTGGAVGFDTLAAQAVLTLEEEYPDIRLHVIKPCENQTRGWSDENREKHDKINEKAFEVKCLSQGYYDGCMQVRNRFLVDNCNLLVAYLTKSDGGSAYTVRYAEKSGKTVINLAEVDEEPQLSFFHTSN